MPTIVARAHQTFPVLDEDQIASARGFAAAEERRFEPAEVIYRAGDKNVPAWLVLEGAIELLRHGGLGPDAPITSLGSGQFTGEVGQLSGRPALASANAGPDGCVALPFDAAHLRALVIGLAEIGEIVMRALILRRVALIEDGGSGTVLIGIPGTAEMRKLQSFLRRSGFPHLVLDSTADEEGLALVQRLAVSENELPLVVSPDGSIYRRPTVPELARCLGLVPDIAPGSEYDVAIVGAGPAGLAAAVYAASEGLSVLVLDSEFFWRTGRRIRAHRKLFRIPDWHHRAGAYRERLQPGPEIWRNDCHPHGGRTLRLRPIAYVACSDSRKPDPGQSEDRGHRERRSVPSTRRTRASRFRRKWRVLLGFPD